jgi:hypothetical protein
VGVSDGHAQQQLLQLPPALLLGHMMGALVPVEFAVQRDTWLAWSRGSLAVAPVSGGWGLLACCCSVVGILDVIL